MKIWIVWNKSLTLKWRTQMEGQMRKLHMSVGKITWPVMIHWLLMYARWVLKKRKEFVVIKLYLYTVFTLIYVTERSRVQVRETASCIKYRVRLRTIHQLVGPLPGPCVCRNLMHQAALFFTLLFMLYWIFPHLCNPSMIFINSWTWYSIFLLKLDMNLVLYKSLT